MTPEGVAAVITRLRSMRVNLPEQLKAQWRMAGQTQLSCWQTRLRRWLDEY